MTYTTTAILKVEADSGLDKFTFSSTPLLPRVNTLATTLTMNRDETKIFKCYDKNIAGEGLINLIAIKAKYPFDVALKYNTSTPSDPPVDNDYAWTGVYSTCYYRVFSEGTVAYPAQIDTIAIKISPDVGVVPSTIETVDVTILMLHGGDV